jgi:hypothetical protein
VSRRFDPRTEAALRAQGWRLAHAPAGITLAGLRAAGAPFKSSKYFDLQAAATAELPVSGGDVAYRPGLLPGSLNEPHAALPGRLAALQPLLPPGAVAAVGPAALYVWLLIDHHARDGAWPLRQCFTWAADASGETHLAVGVFGQARPLIVSPIPEASGRGLGLMPLILPG